MKAVSRQDLRTSGALIVGSGAVAALYPVLRGLEWSRRNYSDGLTVAGMALLVVGLFRMVCRMGVFDSARYGFRKFVEIIRTKNYVHSKSDLPSLADYKARHPYQKKYLPILAAAAVDIVAAMLLA